MFLRSHINCNALISVPLRFTKNRFNVFLKSILVLDLNWKCAVLRFLLHCVWRVLRPTVYGNKETGGER
jgi:hypothetical protein